MVLSGSMEPGFYRGDILFLNMGKAPIRAGEVVVFSLDGRDIPIVHRVIKVHERGTGDLDILTKGRACLYHQFALVSCAFYGIVCFVAGHAYRAAHKHVLQHTHAGQQLCLVVGVLQL